MHYNFVCISFLSSIRPKYFRNREDSKTGGGGHWEPGFHPQFLPIYNSRRHSNGQFITIVRPPPPKFFDIPLSLESKLCFVSRWLATHPQKAVIHSDEALTLLCILIFTVYFFSLINSYIGTFDWFRCRYVHWNNDASLKLIWNFCARYATVCFCSGKTQQKIFTK